MLFKEKCITENRDFYILSVVSDLPLRTMPVYASFTVFIRATGLALKLIAKPQKFPRNFLRKYFCEVFCETEI